MVAFKVIVEKNPLKFIVFSFIKLWKENEHVHYLSSMWTHSLSPSYDFENMLKLVNCNIFFIDISFMRIYNQIYNI